MLMMILIILEVSCCPAYSFFSYVYFDYSTGELDDVLDMYDVSQNF